MTSLPHRSRLQSLSGTGIPRGLQNEPWPLIAGSCIVGILLWGIWDYGDWVGFGTGGTPPTIHGWFKVNRLRAVRAFSYICGDDLQDASALPQTGPRYLSSPIPRRPGGRPSLKSRTLPQRQSPEPIEPQARDALFKLMNHFYHEYPDILRLDLSKTEGGTADAIYARSDRPTCNPEAAQVGYEIAHTHPTDKSLHVLLSPADARTVIEAAWGQRFAVPSMVPPGWIMVYAPRNSEEVEVIAQIVRAAVQWTTGAKLD